MLENEPRLTRIKQMLEDLGQEVSQGRIEAAILEDLKLTVDQLRLSLWAIITYREQARAKGPEAEFGLATKLAEFRIKRLLQMLHELEGDLLSGRIPPSHPDLQRLMTSLGHVLEDATKLVHPGQSKAS